MTPLQNAIQFITAQRDTEQCGISGMELDKDINVDSFRTSPLYLKTQREIDAYDNVLTVLGNAALDATERDAVEQDATEYDGVMLNGKTPGQWCDEYVAKCFLKEQRDV